MPPELPGRSTITGVTGAIVEGCAGTVVPSSVFAIDGEVDDAAAEAAAGLSDVVRGEDKALSLPLPLPWPWVASSAERP